MYPLLPIYRVAVMFPIVYAANREWPVDEVNTVHEIRFLLKIVGHGASGGPYFQYECQDCMWAMGRGETTDILTKESGITDAAKAFMSYHGRMHIMGAQWWKMLSKQQTR